MIEDYRTISMFDDVLEDESDADIIDEYRDFTLVQDPEQNSDGTYNYKIFDDFGILVKTLKGAIDAQSASTSQYKNSNIRRVFVAFVNDEHMGRAIAKNRAAERKAKRAAKTAEVTPKTPRYYADEDDDDTFYRNYDPKTGNWNNRPFSDYGYSYNRSFYQPAPKSTGFLDKLNKSDTLVIHCADRTTDMLAQVYEGKGWDVLRDGNIDKNELHQLMESHERIICLGHGTPSGLINKQGGGLTIGPEEAPYFKGKKIFAIWCNADKYFKQHNIGQGCFITKNVPSEVWEARAVGYEVTAQWMLDNITYWSKCCADVVEQALNGDAKGAVAKARAAYQAEYGDDPNPDQKGVTDYNTDAIQVQS